MNDAMRRIECWATLLVFLSALYVIESASIQTQMQPADERFEVDKKGGARRFYGYFDNSESKRLGDIRPYWVYEKRGGGRAFAPRALNGFSALNMRRLERRGGGRAFYGYRPIYDDSVFDAPAYYRKRSANLWHYLETPDLK